MSPWTLPVGTAKLMRLRETWMFWIFPLFLFFFTFILLQLLEIKIDKFNKVFLKKLTQPKPK